MNNSVGQEVLAQVRKLGFLQRLTYSILAQERFISLSRLSCFSLFFFSISEGELGCVASITV